MERPTGQEWRNWKRSRSKARVKLGLTPNPKCWEAEWKLCQDEKEKSSDGSTVKRLQAEIAFLREEQLTARNIRREIFKLSVENPQPPNWLQDVTISTKTLGVPTLFLSDWHWAEVVDPAQIEGCNAYNLEIAHQRAKRCLGVVKGLLTTSLTNHGYPGIVVALGGDFVSGDIHEELSETNEMPMLPAVVDLFGVLLHVLRDLKATFGKVFVPCVTGNHGRLHKKPRAKNRVFTNLDWLLYTMLEKAFEGDEDVKFIVSEGSDVSFKIYNHRYLLTHGDQFRGGDGQVGALGPCIRGDHRKRGRNGQIGIPYDTMLLGHWHQLIQMQKLIINGSLKGYDEYAYQGNFPFESPKQALWLTHPKHGITFQMPVLVADEIQSQENPWVSWR